MVTGPRALRAMRGKPVGSPLPRTARAWPERRHRVPGQGDDALLLARLVATAGQGDVASLARDMGAALRKVVPGATGSLLCLEGRTGRIHPLHDGDAEDVALRPSDVRLLRRGQCPQGLARARAAPPHVMPLPQGDALAGALLLSRPGRGVSGAEAAVLAAVAPVLASRLAALRRIEETENRLYQLALVNAASRRLSATQGYEALLAEATSGILATFGLDRVALYEVERGTGALSRLAVAGSGDRRVRLPAGAGLPSHAAAHGETVAADELRRDPRARGFRRGLLRSQLSIPLHAEGRTLGVLDLGSHRSGAFDRGTIVILESLALQVTNLLRNAEHFGRAQRAAEKLRALLETSRSISRSLESEDVLQVIAERAKTLLSCRGCTLYELEADGVTLQPLVSREPRFNQEILGTPLRVGKGIVGSVVEAGRPEVVNDAGKDPRALHVPGTNRPAHENLMVAPLSARGAVLGAMTLSRPREPFGADDLDLFGIFAGLAADALFASRLHGEIRRTKDFLERIVESSADAIVATDLAGRITLYSGGAEAMFGYATGEAMGQPVTRYYVKGKEEGRRLMRLLWSRERVANHEIQFVAKKGHAITCMLSASLLRDARGRVVGTLGISKDITERARLEGRLRELSMKDDLTGLGNARHFWEELTAELRRARRERWPLTLFLFDLDGFKGYNDRRGHLAGDEALRRVASLLAGAVRAEVDKAFRYGGDEFVVILPGAGLPAARAIAERVRRRVRLAMRGELGVSAGLAQATGAGTDGRRLVRMADAAMYRAKALGGNRIVDAGAGRRP